MTFAEKRMKFKAARDRLKAELDAVEEAATLQEVGVYTRHYDFQHAGGV